MSDRRDVSKRASWTMFARARLLVPLVLIAGAGCVAEDQDASDIDSVETVRSAVTSGFAKVNAGALPDAGVQGGFIPDDNYSGGTRTSTNHQITIPPDAVGAAPPSVYQTVHWATSTGSPFTYTFRGFNPGSLNLIRLHFAEAWVGLGARVFNVTINGATVLSNFDIFVAAAGQDRAVIKEFTLPAAAIPGGSDVGYVIQFSSVTGKAIVSGIEVVQSPTVQATKIHAGGGALGPFAPDVGFSGGTVVTNNHTVATAGVVHASGPTLYQTGRATTTSSPFFTYTVPGFPANSLNTVRLHFAETSKTGGGQRAFNITINGSLVMQNFDIFYAAGSAVDKAIVREFRVPADAGGNYAIRFDRVTDQALVSGIEVVRSAPWFVRDNMTGSQYDAELAARERAGYRLAYVNGYNVSGTTRYVAAWDLDQSIVYQTMRDMTRTTFETENANHQMFGFSLALVNGYAVGTSDRYAAIWILRSGAPPIFTRVAMNGTAYQTEFNARAAAGWRLVHVGGYTVNGAAMYLGTWEQRTSPAWWSSHAMTAADLTTQVASFQNSGWRIVDLSGYNVSGTDWYTAIFEAGQSPPTTEIHGLSSSQHTLGSDDLHRQGYAPLAVTAFPSGSGQKFASLWQNLAYSASNLTTLDGFAQAKLTAYNLPSMSLAVAKEGRLVYAKAYKGPGDPTGEYHVSNLYRLASVSKPITSVALNKLIDQGKLHQDSKVFGPDPTAVIGEAYGPASAPAQTITIKGLLSHCGGMQDYEDIFNIGASPIPVFAGSGPPNNFPGVLTLPLGSPGSQEYRNTNFYVLGRVIEKLTLPGWTINSPRSYETWVKANILAPIGIPSGNMMIGGNTLADRKPNEVAYFPQPFAYGANPSGMEPSSGWIATPIDMVRLMTRVDALPTVPDLLSAATLSRMYTSQCGDYGLGWRQYTDATGSYVWHEGAFHGAMSSVKRKIGTGLSVVVVTNWNPGNEPTNVTYDVTEGLVSTTVPWPNLDLFDAPN